MNLSSRAQVYRTRKARKPEPKRTEPRAFKVGNVTYFWRESEPAVTPYPAPKERP